ncbi:MAG TPA: hypothetical protein PLE50_07140, partial [Rhabdaerophilum sp.]|nr:hypothetical protein [Rhabdaerophilum sp.]
MKTSLKMGTRLSVAALAAMLAMGTQPAGAEDLFQMLFGGGVKKRTTEKFPEAPKPPKPRAAVKVTGPSYYDYKAEALAKVDFAPLRALPVPAAFEPS